MVAAKPTLGWLPPGKSAAFRGSPIFQISRQKPLFTWRARSGSEFVPHAWKQLNLSVAVQKFFFRLQDERLDGQSAKVRYADEIDAIRASMEGVGVIVDEPKWFSSLFR